MPFGRLSLLLLYHNYNLKRATKAFRVLRVRITTTTKKHTQVKPIERSSGLTFGYIKQLRNSHCIDLAMNCIEKVIEMAIFHAFNKIQQKGELLVQEIKTKMAIDAFVTQPNK